MKKEKIKHKTCNDCTYCDVCKRRRKNGYPCERFYEDYKYIESLSSTLYTPTCNECIFYIQCHMRIEQGTPCKFFKNINDVVIIKKER